MVALTPFAQVARRGAKRGSRRRPCRPLLETIVVEKRGRESTWMWIAPGKVPLEIGATRASVTTAHTKIDHGVARWPCNQDQLTLLVDVACHLRAAPSALPRREG